MNEPNYVREMNVIFLRENESIAGFSNELKFFLQNSLTSSRCYKTFFDGNLDFPLSQNRKNMPF